jgi:hypothetical protein
VPWFPKPAVPDDAPISVKFAETHWHTMNDAVSALLHSDKGVGVMEVMQQELISKVGLALNFQFIDSLNRFRSHCAL